MNRLHPKSLSGFTLMELMVTISIMVLMFTIVAMIFSQSSQTYRGTSELIAIYSGASLVLDYLGTDLNGCLPLETGKQAFSLGEEAAGIDDREARDWISFKAVIPVRNESKTAEVTYRLIPDTDPSILTPTGEPRKETTRKRPLYAMQREVKEADGTVTQSDLCHYVLSFNLEYYDSSIMRFRQISETNPKINWPIGDNNPEGEVLPSGLRITLVVVAGAGAHQERIVTQSIWLPMGQ